jgi:3-methylfumaryl-CoA hydratase
MTGGSLDEAHLRGWIGREDHSEHEVSEDLARRFLATFDDLQTPCTAGAAAPHLLHFCLPQAIVATTALDRDGHPERGHFLPPVPLPRRMWAGGEVRFHDDLRIGERLRRVSKIADVVVKEGRSGTLCFVTVHHALTAGGRQILEDIQFIVYRDEPGRSPTTTVPTAASQGTDQRRVEPTTSLLFRYSALMFNAHRIHYDRDYAVGVEGYPGLVVQGPMMATLMFRLAAELRGRRPDVFTYRGETPLFDIAPFFVHARRDGSGMDLWTASEGGPVAMRSSAQWKS